MDLAAEPWGLTNLIVRDLELEAARPERIPQAKLVRRIVMREGGA